jgi:predicted dehydrogenase
MARFHLQHGKVMDQDRGTPQSAKRNHLLQIAETAQPPRPKQARPIVIIGAGGIVRAAHLPAYQKASFPVLAINDIEPGKAEALAREAGIARTFDKVSELIRFAPTDAVFDLAVPASQLPTILAQLPQGAAVLMQKPMGETLDEARAIRDLCRQRGLTAAVNFSFRYAPNHLVARAIAAEGLLGAIHDIEVQVRTYTPWHLWPFLATAPRLEILYHSIHYLDLVRCWLGEPRSVHAVTVKNPLQPNFAPTRSSILLDYGDDKRVFIVTNHGHEFGFKHQQSFMQWEGTLAAARMTMGVNLDYPRGTDDTLEYRERSHADSPWINLPLTGNTFPDGFIGTMGALQAYVEGSVATLPSNVEEAYKTMALVEACYRSSEKLGERIPSD